MAISGLLAGIKNSYAIPGVDRPGSESWTYGHCVQNSATDARARCSVGCDRDYDGSMVLTDLSLKGTYSSRCARKPGSEQSNAVAKRSCHGFDLDAVDVDMWSIVISTGRRLMHDPRFILVDDKTEVCATYGEYAVVRKEQVMDCGRGDARGSLHTSNVEKVPLRSVVDEDPGTLVAVDIHQHGRQHETEAGRREDTVALHSSGHCEGLGNHPVVCDARHHSVVELV
ncbi:unnamed protein product [Dibothriocephalus latus]|uniref:Uncharacterized protein n=1 Tax=Dibothriocephalus latus TaxID=60516 RepID=A0A3P7NW11_DIBLA|nr:unnamed protein product [Dibothriocephalus latus]